MGILGSWRILFPMLTLRDRGRRICMALWPCDLTSFQSSPTMTKLLSNVSTIIWDQTIFILQILPISPPPTQKSNGPSLIFSCHTPSCKVSFLNYDSIFQYFPHDDNYCHVTSLIEQVFMHIIDLVNHRKRVPRFRKWKSKSLHPPVMFSEWSLRESSMMHVKGCP